HQAGSMPLEECNSGLAAEDLRHSGRIIEYDFDLDDTGVGRGTTVGFDSLHALHGGRDAQDLAAVNRRTAAERDFDPAARRDAADVQLVDVGKHAQLAHVDDLDDAVAGDPLALPRIDLDHDAVERRTHQRPLPVAPRVVQLGGHDVDVGVDLGEVRRQRLL